MPIGLLCKHVAREVCTNRIALQTCNQSLCNPYVIADSMFFLHIKSLPNLLFGVLCLPGGQSHRFAQPTINSLACCICWAGLLGRAVFPPWNKGPNFGSYILSTGFVRRHKGEQECKKSREPTMKSSKTRAFEGRYLCLACLDTGML